MGLPLSAGPGFSRNGTAFSAHSAAPGKSPRPSAETRAQHFVSMIPGISGIAARPGGSSCACACVSPSIPHFVAQSGATSAETDGPLNGISSIRANHPVHINEINATIFHCLGVEHDRFTFRYQGLDQRLTGVEPMKVIRKILS